MKPVNQDKIKKIFSIILVIGWLILIFYFSNQKGNISENSSGFIINLLNSISKKFNLDLTSFEFITFLVRKSAHMFLYFVLYFLTYNAMNQFNIPKKKVLALLFCFLYAISDELHQFFIPGRSCQMIDIFIDTLGSLIALMCIFLKNKFIKPCKL